MLRKILPEGVEMLYLVDRARHGDLKAIWRDHSEDELLHNEDVMAELSCMEWCLERMTNVRLCAIRNWPSRTGLNKAAFVPALLHWEGEIDLTMIDDLASEGVARDADFFDAIPCQHHRMLCRVCGTVSDALTVDLSPFYTYPVDLHERKARRRVWRVCPSCGSSYGSWVAQLL